MATAFTQEMADAIVAQTIAIQNLDAFYLLVLGTFVLFMQVPEALWDWPVCSELRRPLLALAGEQADWNRAGTPRSEMAMGLREPRRAGKACISLAVHPATRLRAG
jgi:hypothetical protein